MAELERAAGDKAYDADWLRDDFKQGGVESVISPPRAKRPIPASYSAEKYKWRHLIDNFFQELKEFRGVAILSCKTDSSIAASMIRSR